MEVIILVLMLLIPCMADGMHPLDSADFKGAKNDFKSFPWNVANRYNSDDENFYQFFNNITHGKIFNISTKNHEIFKQMGYHWPDLDPKDFPVFNCSTQRTRHHVKPTSVHKLAPFDIDVVAAMGDSITAGFGALSFTLIDLFVEYRGVSWSIGGDQNLKKRITIPNIFKEYNPMVRGYSTGIAPALIPLPWEHLNVAVSGATAYGLMKQAERLVSQLTTDPHYDLYNDWKVLTIFIGGNDLCACCRKFKDYNVLYSPANYIREIKEVLDYLSSKVPRLFVNMVNAPDVTVLNLLNTPKCDVTHFIECKCGTVFGKVARNYTENVGLTYHELLRELVVHSGRYDNKEDFTVVLQPFFDKTIVPRRKDGSIDRSYWAPDCFHFSGKAHAASALGLWNNMLQPVGTKSRKWKAGDIYKCPTTENPYFYTNLNSKSSS